MPAPHAARFGERSGRYALYFEALSGTSPSFHLYDHTQARTIPADTSVTIRLPECVDHWERTEFNWDWYRVALAHRAARRHTAHGSFTLTGDEPVPRELLRAGEKNYPHPPGNPAERLRRALSAFPKAASARELFDVAEGLRLDEVVRRTLPGLRPALDRVREAAYLSLGNDNQPANVRQAFLTELVAQTVHDSARERTILKQLVGALTDAHSVLAALVAPGATVATSLEATAHLYALLYGLAPARLSDETEAYVLEPLSSHRVPLSADRLTLPTAHDRPALEGEDQYQFRPPRVEYRGSMGSLDVAHHGTGRVRPSALFAWREGEDEGDHEHHHAPATGMPHREGSREDQEVSQSHNLPLPRAHEHEGGSSWEISYVPKQLRRRERVQVYPEWDVFANAYKQQFCEVIEDSLQVSPGGGDFSRRVLAAHAGVIRDLAQRWIHLPAVGLSRLRRLADGDDLDLSAIVDSYVEFRARGAVNDEVFTRQAPSVRDVGTTLLIDSSMSTARRVGSQSGDPHDSGLAMSIYGKKTRSVLDVEREAAVVLGIVAERMGDQVAILASSSLGRSAVRAYDLKDESEPMTPVAGRRISALKPMDGTRLGAAVRHATRRASRSGARSKYLVIISDGLPFDFDYGSEYVGAELEYAQGDVQRAISEAEGAGVRTSMIVLGLPDESRDALPPNWSHVADLRDLPAALSENYLTLRQRAAS